VALGALLGMFGGVATAAPALAGGRGDGWEFLDLPKTFTVPAEFCGFEVQGTQLVNKMFQKELKTADGSVIILSNGAFKATLTNPANGKSITVNKSGPAKFVLHPDGSVTALETGHQLTVLDPADAARFGLPIFFVSAGALTANVDANGNLTSVSLHGHVLVDVCAALS